MITKTDKKSSRRSILANNFWLLKQVWKYTPGYMIWMIVEGVVWGINHSINIIYVQRLFDALGEQSGFERITRIILAYGVYLIFFYIFHNWYWQIYNPKIREKLHIAMHSDMFRQAVNIDLEKYDDPVFYNDFIWAMEQSFSHAIGLMEDTGKLINRIVASVTLTGVILSVDITMAMMIFAIAAVVIVITYLNNRINLNYHDALNPIDRKSNYIKRVFKLPDYAKELRITHISENLFDEYNGNIDLKKKVISKYGKKLALLHFMMNEIKMLGEIGLIILMLYKVMVTKEIGLGGFAVGVNACWKMTWLLQDMVQRILKYHEHGIFIEKMITFMNCKPEIKDGTDIAAPFESLVIRNLKFSYNQKSSKRGPTLSKLGHQGNAVDDVTMEIYRGEKIAIVGYNGAGKTTLTKLLMRLYDPDEGEILYNGKDIRKYTVSSLREHIAAVFQDYRIFACTITENVVGGKYAATDEAKVKASLEKSTFSDKLQSLTDGLNTQLTREFDSNGTQLSGGEQQKIAIARAFYKDADLIILDEPSSALDPDAEYELNKAITSYADTRTVIFISHRLSTTRHADRIYMFDGGKLIESGTHEELMAVNGKYAYIFRLQAEKYRE